MSRVLKNFLFGSVFLVALLANMFTLKTIFHRTEYQVGIGEMGIGMPEGEKHGDNVPKDIPFDDRDMRDWELGEDTNPPQEKGEKNFGDRTILNNGKIDDSTLLLKGVVIIEVITMAGCIVYLVMSKFNKKTFKETFKSTEKVTIFILGITTLSLIVGGCELYFTKNLQFSDMNRREDQTEKDTKKEDIESGVVVREENIFLDEYDSNITIDKAGSYTLSGRFDHMVLIDADGEVTLNLDGVTIENDISAAIANVSANELIINLVEGTKSILSDGGSSEYDACIYSEGKLTIKGNGYLKVSGNQEEGEGIATETNDITIDGGHIEIESNDDGINAGGNGGLITINGGVIFIKASGDGVDSNKNLKINGGTIYTMGSSVGGDAGIDTDDGFQIDGGILIALGSDMLETPLTTSKQNSICFNLSSKIKKETLVSLVSENGEEIISFEAQEDFKTLIISSDKLEEGNYHLYTGGKHSGNLSNYIYDGGNYTLGELVTINGKDSFRISGSVTNIK